jgi:hypothetical protein
MAVEAIPLLDADGAGPEFFQDVLHTGEGTGVLQVAQLHGLVDGPAAPVHPHHRIAVRCGRGARAETLGVDVPLRSLNTRQEGRLQPDEFLLIVLEKAEDLGSQEANRRGRSDSGDRDTHRSLQGRGMAHAAHRLRVEAQGPTREAGTPGMGRARAEQRAGQQQQDEPGTTGADRGRHELPTNHAR